MSTSGRPSNSIHNAPKDNTKPTPTVISGPTISEVQETVPTKPGEMLAKAMGFIDTNDPDEARFLMHYQKLLQHKEAKAKEAAEQAANEEAEAKRKREQDHKNEVQQENGKGNTKRSGEPDAKKVAKGGKGSEQASSSTPPTQS